MSEITRYFGQQSQEQILDVRTLSIEKQYNIFGQLRALSIVYHKLWITIDYIPDSISISGDLFLLHFTGSNNNLRGAVLSQINLTSYDNNYQVIIAPNAIVDCSDVKLTEFDVKYTIHGIKDNGGIETSVSNVVHIRMHKSTPSLNTRFEFVETDQLTFTNSDRVLLGNLCILNNTPVRYAENLNIGISLRYNDRFDADIVSWGDVSEITESNPFYDVNSGLCHNELHSSLIKTIDIDELMLQNIVAQNEIRIPIYIDMQRIGNPTARPLNTSMGLSIKNLNTSNIENKIVPFTIKQDTQQTQLLVKINGMDLLNDNELHLGLFKWIEFRAGTQNRFAGGSEIIKIQIGNAASSVSNCAYASVIIRNFNLSFISSSETSKAIIEALTPTNVPVLDKFYNAPNSYETICYELEHNKVSNMNENRVSISARLEFDYFEDIDGEYIEDETPMSHFCGILDFDVEKDPGCDWLCVDYGTSASVAAFGDGSYRNTQVLNLDERLLELLQNVAPVLQSPRFEEGTPFLSSNVIFRSIAGVLNAHQYDKRLLWLSPSEPQFQGNNGMMLPYMKALVGYNHLPNISSYSTLQYKINQDDESVVSMADAELTIEQIFKATYDSLFRDFILPSINKLNKRANKLVLTVPNTYTSRHMDYIRRIVVDTLPEIRPEYIWFVSESDAIACYYIHKWQQLNRDRSEEERDQLRNESEHILAFDMGAGTLDVTYFSIEPDDDECKKLEIKAKIGLNKAGNYLDYILARVLIDTHPIFPESIITPSYVRNDTNLQRLATQFTHFIKTKLKVSLFSEDEITFSEWNGEMLKETTIDNIPIDLRRIRGHRLISEFITEVTHNLLDNFFKVNGYEEGETPIDTVILSGRSVQFGNGSSSIEENVMQAVQKWNGGVTSYKIKLQGDTLKTIVSEGALYFATIYSDTASIVKIRNRNLYASYGVVYTTPNGQTAYCELLNPKTRPTKAPNLDDNSTNGVYIYQYDTDRYNAHDRREIKLDLRGGSVAYFVQSYSNDTAKDWDAGCRDLITEMYPFNTRQTVATASELRSVPVRIVVNADGEMLFYAGMIHDEATAPLRIDVTDSKSFNESMWPYL